MSGSKKDYRKSHNNQRVAITGPEDSDKKLNNSSTRKKVNNRTKSCGTSTMKMSTP